ncbi:MAG: phospho-sugar mutase [Spirochaetales bacterium]|nr:phospho-sugar mutase [Spirochaetales bacterium]
MDYRKEYERWLKEAPLFHDELAAMDEKTIEDAFYRDLEFGTAGLRGVLGAGTNRMNEYVIGRATQGLASYLLSSCASPSVAIGYDSRIKSDVFSRVAAEVLAANGVRVYLYPVLMPVPCVSFAVRYFNCTAGIMVTASHNPSKYNGYKVYGSDGCQITDDAASAILAAIEKTDTFSGVKHGSFDAFVSSGLISFIGEDCYSAFISEVKKCSVLYGDEVDKNVAIVYSPLNGAGLKPVLRVLNETGFTNVTVVKEQEQPDGNFPTCPYPNPEIRAALQLGLEYASRLNADLMLATDPDCDRVGIAVRDGSEMKLLTGNETGMLLLDYICSQRVAHDSMPISPVFVKTIVTSDMAGRIASHYGVRTVNVLTGFKYIGEQIGLLEAAGHPESYILGFEESYGYLSGTHARDKDAVNASFLICEMFAFYKTRGISLLDKLNQLYKEYGYCLIRQHSYEFPGSAGFARMKEIMDGLRSGVPEFIGGLRVLSVVDYGPGIDGLPKANVIKFVLEGNCSAIIRPSGTEPKIKNYVTVTAADLAAAEVVEKGIAAHFEKVFGV